VAGVLASTGAAGVAYASSPTHSAVTSATSGSTATSATLPVYKGRVVSRIGLLVRSGPSQRYRVIGSLRSGQIVWITCKVNGQWINGNPRWYRLAGGGWAWASARYIANIGAAPRWC
jgi:uncharacterized protein YraI